MARVTSPEAPRAAGRRTPPDRRMAGVLGLVTGELLARWPPWRWFLALQALAVAVHALLATRVASAGGDLTWVLGQMAVFGSATAGSVLAIAAGVRRNRPAYPLAWWLIAIGMATPLLGGGLTYAFDEMPAFPSVGEALYLAGYPLEAAGLLFLVRGRGGRSDRGGFLDAVILATGLAMVTWEYVIVPRVAAPHLGLPATLAFVAYPAAGVLLLFTIVRLLVASGPRPPAFWLLLAGLCVQVVTDTLYGATALAGTYVGGGPVDTGWIVWQASWGLAALHPSMRLVGGPLMAAPRRLTTRRIVFLVTVAMLSPMLLTLQVLWGGDPQLGVVVAGTAILLAAVSFRIRLLAAEVAAVTTMRRVLLDRAVRAGETERVRLASELHDGPIQRLAGLGLNLSLARRRLARGEAAASDEALRAAEERLTAEVEALRQLMAELRPPILEEYGLHAGLRQHAEDFSARTGTACAVETEPVDGLDPAQEIVLYRVAQEALVNVAKHANAATVTVRLGVVEGGARLEVTDDGVGFDAADAPRLVASRHYGLVSMRERVKMAGGTWSLRSRPGEGTAIVATLPAGGVACDGGGDDRDDLPPRARAQTRA